MIVCACYYLYNKFLNNQEMESIKEMISMTVLAQMFIEDGIAIGLQKGIQVARIGLIRKKISKGYSPDTIKDFLECEEDYVQKVIGIMKEYPEATDTELADILMKSQ